MSSKKSTITDSKPKTKAKSRNRRSARKVTINAGDHEKELVENKSGRKGKKCKDEKEEAIEEFEEDDDHDGDKADEEKDGFQTMIDLVPSYDLDCCPVESPAHPGTPVALNGVILHETVGGLLILNIRWRGKVLSGALIDVDKNKWAPERIIPDPLPPANSDIKRFAPPPFPLRKFKEKGEEVDSKKKVPSPPTPVKGKNGKNGGKVVKREGVKEEDASYKKTRLAMAQMENGYIECPEPGCDKKYKHMNGLKYHLKTVHPDKDGEDSGKENKSGEDSDSEVEEEKTEVPDKPDDKVDDETSNDSKESVKPKKKGRKKVGKGSGSDSEKEASVETNEKEELTETEKRIEDLRIEANKATAQLQHLIKQENDYDETQQDDDTAMKEVVVKQEVTDALEQESERKYSAPGIVKRDNYKPDPEQMEEGEGNLVVDVESESQLVAKQTDNKQVVATTDDNRSSELRETATAPVSIVVSGIANSRSTVEPDGKTNEQSERVDLMKPPTLLAPNLPNYSQYSPTLGSLNPQEINNSLSNALLNSKTQAAETMSTVSKEGIDAKAELCSKPSLEIANKMTGFEQAQALQRAAFKSEQLRLAELMMSSSKGKVSSSTSSTMMGPDDVPASDEERSGNASPDGPLIGCSKIHVMVASGGKEDNSGPMLPSELLLSKLREPIDANKTAESSRHEGFPPGQKHMAATATGFLQDASSSSTGPHANRLSAHSMLSKSNPTLFGDISQRVAAGLDSTMKQPHVSPKLLDLMKSGKKPVDEVAISQAASNSNDMKTSLLEMRLSQSVENPVLLPGCSKIASSSIQPPSFLLPNISAGRPIARTATSQDGALPPSSKDSTSDQEKVSNSFMKSRPIDGSQLTASVTVSVPTSETIWKASGKSPGFVSPSGALRINPPLTSESRSQIGVKTWVPQEVYVKTSLPTSDLLNPSSDAAPKLAPSPTDSGHPSLINLSFLQTSSISSEYLMSRAINTSLSKGKPPPPGQAKKTGQPVLIAPAPVATAITTTSPPSSRIEQELGKVASPTDSDKVQSQMSRFTLTRDNRLIPSPVENRGRPRKVRVERTQQIPIGTAQDIERSRGPAETALIRKRPPSPVIRASVIQASTQALSPTEEMMNPLHRGGMGDYPSSMSPPDKRMKMAEMRGVEMRGAEMRGAEMRGAEMRGEYRKENSARLMDGLTSSEEHERSILLQESRQAADIRQHQENFKAFPTSISAAAFPPSIPPAASRISSPPGRLTSPRAVDAGRPHPNSQLHSPRVSRASPMNNPYQHMFMNSQLEEMKSVGEADSNSRKELADRQIKLLMDMNSASIPEHMRSSMQSRAGPISPHNPYILQQSSASAPPGHFHSAGQHGSDSDKEKMSGRGDQPFSQFLFPKLESDHGAAAAQRMAELQRAAPPPRAMADSLSSFGSARFPTPLSGAFMSRSEHEPVRSEHSMFERRNEDARADGHPPSRHDSRYSHPSSSMQLGNYRERTPLHLGRPAGAQQPPNLHHNANLVLGRADGAIIRPLAFENRGQHDNKR